MLPVAAFVELQLYAWISHEARLMLPVAAFVESQLYAWIRVTRR